MVVSRGFLEYVLEQLSGLGRVAGRRMFGAVGLYEGALFFGLIDDDVLYLRVDDSNRDDYDARGMGPFRPYPDKPDYSMSYYQVPADVLEDAGQLVAWARRSTAIAASSPAKRARPTGRAAARRRPRRRSLRRR